VLKQKLGGVAGIRQLKEVRRGPRPGASRAGPEGNFRKELIGLWVRREKLKEAFLRSFEDKVGSKLGQIT